MSLLKNKKLNLSLGHELLKQCVEENDLEINLMRIPFAKMCFGPSDFNAEGMDSPDGMSVVGSSSKLISCKRYGFTHVPWIFLHKEREREREGVFACKPHQCMFVPH